MFTHFALTLLAFSAQEATPAPGMLHEAQASHASHAPSREVEPTARVEGAHDRVTVTISPLSIQGGTDYHRHGPDGHASFAWPEDGWVQGYRMDLIDANGQTLPSAMLHHAGVVNLERRQLAYPMIERLFAAGRETGHVTLPRWMGVRMAEGQAIVVYFALANDSDQPVEGASLRIAFDWRPIDSGPTLGRAVARSRSVRYSAAARGSAGRMVEVVPLILSANPNDGLGSLFDVPPGRSNKTAEFILPVGGYLRALGGHVHDYAVELRLEDVETGRVIARLDVRTDPVGRLQGVEVERFVFRPRGLRLEPDHRYRVVGVYDNPTGATIPGGAMAYMAGPFVPDDLSQWPEIDPEDPMYVRDRARMMAEGQH